MKKRAIQGKWERDLALSVERSTINEEARTVELALSSETPYERWYGTEILGHGPGEVNLSRLQNKAAWLMDHNARDQVGVIEEARVDADRVLRCLVRFGRSARAQEIFQDIIDGIRTKVSVGYMTGDYDFTKGEHGAPDTYRFKGWTPFEGSTVSIPADDSVGVGRDGSGCQNEDCTDPECENGDCEGECSAEMKCKSCTSKKASTTPGQTRELPPNPPAVPAGTARKESIMDPETIAAAQKAAEDLRNQERAEAVQLHVIATGLGLGREAAEILGGSTPFPEARQRLQALFAERASKPLPGPGIDMSQKEAKEYSYARAVLNAVLRREGQKVERSFEDEVAETIQRALPEGYKYRGGVMVPTQLRARITGLDTGTANSGQELNYTVFGGELIELLRNAACVTRMGATLLPGLTSPVSFPRQTGAATVNWMAENAGTDASGSAPSFDTVTLTPKTMIGVTPFSRQLLQQSVIAVEPLLRRELAVGHALAFDKAALHGTGTGNQPTGIYKTTGVGAKAMGGVPTHGKLQDMITAVATANALMNNLGFLTTPGMAGVLAQTLVASAAGSKMIWDGKYDDGLVNGYKAMATNQVSALMSGTAATGGTEHGIIFGDWSNLLIGTWGALELLTDPYTLAAQGMIKITSFEMGDVEIRHPAGFEVSTGATLS